MTSKDQIRESVINVLILLSSKENQCQYLKQHPSSNMALELLCLWFDKLYNPGTPLFKQSFTASELVLIQEFNRNYDLLKGQLPETIEELHLGVDWNNMMLKAKKLLDELR